MTNLTELFRDDYNFETLALVSVIVIIPIMVVLALVGFNLNTVLGLSLVGVEILIFPLWLIANNIRDAGRKLEKNLFRDGMPTTISLRLRTSAVYDVSNRRWRLEKITNVKFYNKEQELSDPNGADDRIIDAVNIAKEKMRDPKIFKLLRRELKSYGFWRNMLAAKKWGLWIAITCLVFAMVSLIFNQHRRYLSIIAILVSLIFCVYWNSGVNEKRVFDAAERYKEQFFKSLSILLKPN